MGVVARQSFKSGVLTYFGIAMGMANTVFFYPYFLSVEQIGVLSFIAQVSVLFLPFIILGFSNVLIKYFSYYQNSIERKNYFYSFIISVVGLSSLAFVFIYTFLFDDIREHFSSDAQINNVTLFVLVGVAAIMPVTEIFQQYCSSYKRTAVPSLLNQIYKLVTPLLAAGFFFGFYSFEYVLIGILIYYVVLAIIYRFYLNHLDNLSFKLPKLSVLAKDPNLKSMFAFAIFGLVGGLGYSFSNQIDILMLTDISGSYQTGIYSWAFNIANAIATPLALISAIGLPLIASYWKNNDIDSIRLLYQQSSSTLFVISLGLFFAVLLGLDDLFAIMPKGDKFSACKTTFIILGVAKLIDLAAGLNNQIIAMSKYYLYNVLFIFITAVLNVVLNLILIPMHGLEGCAVATLISVFGFNSMKLLFIYYKFKMQPLQLKMLGTLAIGIILAYAIFQMPKFDYNIINIIVYSSGFILLYGLTNYKFKLAPEINEFVNKQLKRIGFEPFD